MELNQFQVTTYGDSGGPRSYLEQRRTVAALDAGKVAGLSAAPQPIKYALPITGTAKIVSTIDVFDVPTFLGGGSASTTATNGTLDIKFTASGDPNVLNIEVTGVHTDTANIIVPGGATGDLHGTLNPDFPSVGTLNLRTGLVELLFSQILTSDTYPDIQVKTFSAYYAGCGSCVLNGDMTLFEGDSIFLEP